MMMIKAINKQTSTVLIIIIILKAEKITQQIQIRAVKKTRRSRQW